MYNFITLQNFHFHFLRQNLNKTEEYSIIIFSKYYQSSAIDRGFEPWSGKTKD